MASRFWVGGTGTWDASDTTHWSATTGGAGGQSVPGSADTATFDASSGGGTVTVSHASNSIVSLTMGAFTGTLDFAPNDNNITLGSFSGSGSGTRTLNMGDGTWTITLAAGTAWSMTTTTNLTFAANASTISFVATATSQRIFDGGGLTYNNVTWANAAANNREVFIGGSNTFANLTFTLCQNVKLNAATTQTVSTALTYSRPATAPGILTTSTGSTATLSVANATVLDWLAITGITKAGAGSITANNCFDCGNNASVVFTHPALRAGFSLGM